MSKSFIGEAYSIILSSKKEIAFADLLQKVGANLGITDEEELIKKAGAFYTDLSLDGRFVVFPGNFWDLKSRHVSNLSHLEVNEVNTDDSDDEKVPELGEATDEEKKIDYDSDDSDDDDDLNTSNIINNSDLDA